MGHICDTRCFNENSGHHAWPSPQPGECLCGQEVLENKVWCPLHRRSDLQEAPRHKPGCPATGGYGHGVEACICGTDKPADDVESLKKQLAETEKERDALRGFVRQIAGAPDSQVSAFVRAACAGYLSLGDNTIPPGDPFAENIRLKMRLAEAEKKMHQLIVAHAKLTASEPYPGKNS